MQWILLQLSLGEPLVAQLADVRAGAQALKCRQDRREAKPVDAHTMALTGLETSRNHGKSMKINEKSMNITENR